MVENEEDFEEEERKESSRLSKENDDKTRATNKDNIMQQPQTVIIQDRARAEQKIIGIDEKHPVEKEGKDIIDKK